MSEIRVSEIRISSNHRELHGAIFDLFGANSATCLHCGGTECARESGEAWQIRLVSTNAFQEPAQWHRQPNVKEQPRSCDEPLMSFLNFGCMSVPRTWQMKDHHTSCELNLPVWIVSTSTEPSSSTRSRDLQFVLCLFVGEIKCYSQHNTASTENRRNKYGFKTLFKNPPTETDKISSRWIIFQYLIRIQRSDRNKPRRPRGEEHLSNARDAEL